MTIAHIGMTIDKNWWSMAIYHWRNRFLIIVHIDVKVASLRRHSVKVLSKTAGNGYFASSESKYGKLCLPSPASF